MSSRGKELLERLSHDVVLGDGAMGTMLYARGVPLGSCYDQLNLTDRELVKSIHRQYVVAGADVIETNTFGANRVWLRPFGLAERAREINLEGARLAREVAGDRVFVAGSIGPMGLKTGEEVPPDAADGYREQALALAEGGCDLLMLETFLSLEELSVALGAVKAATPDLPVAACMAIFEKGRTARGVSIEAACRRACELGVDIFGTNCGKGPRQLIDALERLVRAGPIGEGTVLAAYPNAGYPEFVNGRYMYVATPEYMADAARRLAAAGVALIGGCCGTAPADIAAIKMALRLRKRTPLSEARARLASEAPPAPASAVEVAPAGREAAAGRRRGDRAGLEEGDGILPPAPPGEAEFVRRARARATGGAGAERPPILIEYDAPKDLDLEKALKGARLLVKAGIDAVTVGDNPLAIMRMSALAFSHLLQRATGRPVLAHFSCRDRNLLATQSELMGLYALGIHNILAITGDPASIGNQPGATSVYDLNSFGLVELMARMNRGENVVGAPLACRTSFTIAVALNPNGRRIDDQLRRLRRKVDLGAHIALTQPCFDVPRIREMYERAAPMGIPIFLGVLPLTSQRAADFLHNEVPGIDVPERVRARLEGLDGEAGKAEGRAIAREIIEETFEIAHGYYLIPPFNNPRNVLELVSEIRARSRPVRP